MTSTSPTPVPDERDAGPAAPAPASTVVVLTEQALGDDDARRIADLHATEPTRYQVLVPADTERNLLVDVLDHLSLFDLRAALGELRSDPDPHEARATALEALDRSLAALQAHGLQAQGRVTQDDPLPALVSAVEQHGAREVVVVTRPHAVEDTFHLDWASRARDEVGVPVLHVYAGTTFLG